MVILVIVVVLVVVVALVLVVVVLVSFHWFAIASGIVCPYCVVHCFWSGCRYWFCS